MPLPASHFTLFFPPHRYAPSLTILLCHFLMRGTKLYFIHLEKVKSAHLKMVKRWRCVSDNECGNTTPFYARTEKRTLMKQTQRALPSVRYRSIVHGLHCQSIAPADCELNAWCHCNDPSAVNTVHSVL